MQKILPETLPNRTSKRVPSRISSRKPRILIDARMVSPIAHGIARYVTQIASGLNQIKTNSGQELPYELLFLVRSGLTSEFLTTTFPGIKTVETQISFLSVLELTEIPKILRRHQIDLYHSPSFSSFISLPCPHLVTIHDLIHLFYGNWHQKAYYRLLLRRFALRAQAILTVSRFSQQEIAKWLKLPPEKIDLIYNSIPDAFKREMVPQSSQSICLEYGLAPGKYFYCLSNPKSHKNVRFLIKAYQEYRKIRLAQSGDGAAGKKEVWPLVLTLKGFEKQPGVLCVGPLEDFENKAILSHAGGLVFPSLYEGFGLPPVEAAVSGLRLAVSRIPAHQEGLAALSAEEVLWIDPDDLTGWAQAFCQIQNHEVLPPSPESQGRLRSQYSTQKMGLAIDQVYCKILHNLRLIESERMPQFKSPTRQLET